MHMADALVSPIVGGTMLAVTVGIAALSVSKVKKEMDEKKIPLMGVMGAFVFALQMINFSIPGTGSSGHIGGGLLLAVVLGPYAGFLSMAVILLIQALVFADGGLLAYGCNVFNLAFFSSFLMYPLIYTKITGKRSGSTRIIIASVVCSVVGLELGAFSVVVETFFSGRADLPFGTFVLFMQPVHLAIGAVEGAVTGAILGFVYKARPELLDYAAKGKPLGRLKIRPVVIAVAAAALVTGGVISWFASSFPDGLEWSIQRTSGKDKSAISSKTQETISVLPDYGFRKTVDGNAGTEKTDPAWPNPDAGTSLSGIIGGGIVFAIASCTGVVIWLVKRRRKLKA